MNHIVKDIIAFTNEKTPIYKIIYAEPRVLSQQDDCLHLDLVIRTIILDYNTWKCNLPFWYLQEEEEELLERWNKVIDKETLDIGKEHLTGKTDPDNNVIYCRKLSINLLN